MSDRIFLVDAMAFAFRAFHAIKAGLSDPKGRPTNAVYGFTRILLKVLRDHSPSHVAVVFDAPGPTFRDEMYAEYKATRRETPPELLEQFPSMHDVVRALNLPLFCVPGVEADDVIGTLACRAGTAGMEAVLVSGDKDLQQLVTDTVRVFDPGKGDAGVWIGPDEVRERFGTDPAHVVDALALIGDTADNVPGVRGIGDKTAQKLMAQYGSLEGLYAHLDDLKGKQKENLEADRDKAFFSRELVTIRTDVALPMDVADCVLREPDPERVRACFAELGFDSLMAEAGGAAPPQPETLAYTLVLDEDTLARAVAEMRAAGCFAVDTETTSVDPMLAELVGVSLSCAPCTGYYIPVGHTLDALTYMSDPDDLTSVVELNPVPKEKALEMLRPLLEDGSVGKIGHNIKYDIIVFGNAGIHLQGVAMDTMVASYLIDPSRLRHNLDEVCVHYLKRANIPISELIGRGAKTVTFDEVPVVKACDYASEDADVALRLAGLFKPILRERGLEELNRDMELPLIQVLARMEQAGITLDPVVFSDMSVELASRLADLETRIHETAGSPFNINSPKQLQEILFGKLGLRTVRKTKTGQSTDVDVLEELSAEHPLPALILEYRSLEKLRGTYVDALPRMVNPRTGRVHTSFNQAVAATGRLSSSDPNLQNIPVRTADGRRIRAGFVAGGEGLVLVSADYSQIELRVMAHLSGDAGLRAAFEGGADIHRETAARVFGVMPELVSPEMRRQAKAVNFGVIYGISEFGLARNLGIPRAAAGRFISDYFNQYPGVRAWLDGILEQAKRDGYVTTLFQRRRYLPELSGGDPNVRKAAERAAINTPVQGTAADIIKMAMVRLDPLLGRTDARMLLQVHDELVVETPAERAEETAALMRETMESVADLSVPLKVDIGTGRNWAEIH